MTTWPSPTCCGSPPHCWPQASRTVLPLSGAGHRVAGSAAGSLLLLERDFLKKSLGVEHGGPAERTPGRTPES